MSKFEKIYRTRIENNLELLSIGNQHGIFGDDPIKSTNTFISKLRENTTDEKIKSLFLKCACHLPHNKLAKARKVYQQYKSLEKTIKQLENDYKIDIKEYKNLSDEQVEEIIKRGWGLAGTLQNNYIIATKIPSMFHEYFNEDNPQRRKYYYCHCPRVKEAFLKNEVIDPIYCNCGGGFYVDVWEFITGKTVNIKIMKSLFNGDDVCSFKIEIND